MHRRPTSLLLMIMGTVLAPLPPSPGARMERARPFELPPVTYDRLLNGLLVLVAEDRREPYVIIKLLLKYGTAFDLQGKTGTAWMTVNALALGGEVQPRDRTNRRPAGVEAEAKVVECDQDHLTLSLRVAARDAPAALRHLASLVTDPDFSDATLSRINADLRPRAVTDIEPLGAVEEHLKRLIYRRHPYARPPLGYAEDLVSIKSADLARYYRQFFIANHAVLIVVGDVQRDAVQPIIRSEFGPMRKGDLTPAGFVFTPPSGGPRLRLGRSGSPESVGIGTAVVEYSHPDYLPLFLLDRVIAARLQRTQISPGSTIAVETALQTKLVGGSLSGYWQAAALVPATEAASALSALLDVCRQVREGAVSSAEVDAARASLIGDFKSQVNSLTGISDLLGRIELYGLGRDWAMAYPARLNLVSPEDLQRVANSYLKPERMVGVVIGNPGDQMDGLKKLGTVEELP